MLSGKEARWELLTLQDARNPAAGYHSAGPQTCWHKNLLQRAKYPCEHVPSLLLPGLCTSLPGIQLPWKLLLPKATYLGHCKLAGPAGMP